MSGGSFDYAQYHIQDIAEELERISHEASTGDDEYYANMPDDIKEDIHNVMCVLMRCKVYIDRLDYYIAGDDGEESYRERLAEDLQDNETAHQICTKI